MTLTDFTPTQEPTPVIESLRRFLQKGGRFLSNPSPSLGNLRMWTAGVRSHLSKIYGKDEPQLSYFSQLTGGLPAHQVREELSRRVRHLERIVAGLENLPALTQTASYGRRIFIGHGRSPIWRVL